MSLTVISVRAAFTVAFPRLDLTVAVAGIDQPAGTLSLNELNDELPSFVNVKMNGPDDAVGVAGDTVSVYCFSAPSAGPDAKANTAMAAAKNLVKNLRKAFILDLSRKISTNPPKNVPAAIRFLRLLILGVCMLRPRRDGSE